MTDKIGSPSSAGTRAPERNDRPVPAQTQSTTACEATTSVAAEDICEKKPSPLGEAETSLPALSLVEPWTRSPLADTPVDPEVARRLVEAKQLLKSGRKEASYGIMLTLLNSIPLGSQARAQAALGLCELQLASKETFLAELSYLEAVRLDAWVPGRELTKARLHVAGGDHETAVAEIDAFIAFHGASPDVLALKAWTLAEDCRQADALKAVQECLRLDPSEVPVLRTCGRVLFQCGRADEALRIFRTILERDPYDSCAHSYMAELTPPPKAISPAVKQHFAAADAAYARGDFAEVKKRALSILALGENSLAHAMFSTACERLEDQAADAQAGTCKRTAEIDTREERVALVRHFTDLCSRMQIEADGGRAARPGDLFPEWEQLTAEQQAMCAFSALAFGKLLGPILDGGLKVRIANVGTSCLELDGSLNGDAKASDYGRYFYAGRGWTHGNRIVMGLELLDRDVRGEGSDVVLHEMAHFVHQRLLERGGGSNRELAWRIEDLYAEAVSRGAGQELYDYYSKTDQLEYFAMALTAYMDPTGDSAELYKRNPKVWQFCKQFLDRFGDYPPGAKPAPLPQAQTDLSLLALAGVRNNSAVPLCVRQGATATLAHLAELYQLGAKPSAELEKDRVTVLARGRELLEIASGKKDLPANYIGDPLGTIGVMTATELQAQARAERYVIDLMIDEAWKYGCIDVVRLKALKMKLSGLEHDTAAFIKRPVIGGPASLAGMRSRLVELHESTCKLWELWEPSDS